MGFEVGQKVVCIQGTQSLKYGKIYKVLQSSNCSCSQNINVGITGRTAPTTCALCGGIIDMGSEVNWYHVRLFAPLDEWEEAEEAKEHLLEELNEEQEARL